MFFARMVFFRLHESPRYLVHAGRHQEALQSLQMISRFNGADLSLKLADVHDELHPEDADAKEDDDPSLARRSSSLRRSSTLFDAGDDLDDEGNQRPQHPRHTSSTRRASPLTLATFIAANLTASGARTSGVSAGRPTRAAARRALMICSSWGVV